MPTTEFDGWECNRCGHQWVPIRPGHKPKGCPKCNSPYWDTERLRAITRASSKIVLALVEAIEHVLDDRKLGESWPEHWQALEDALNAVKGEVVSHA